MLVNKLVSSNITNTVFKGDKNVFQSLASSGMDDRGKLISDDIYINRNDVSEKDFIDKILTNSGAKPNFFERINILNKARLNNYLVTGSPAAGKSTFILRIGKMLEDKGIKTFALTDLRSVNNLPCDPLVYKIQDYLKSNAKDEPIVIFIDEFQMKVKSYKYLENLVRNKPNVKIVCTVPSSSLAKGNKLIQYFPKDNILVFHKNENKFIEMLNGALKAAGFEKVPPNFEQKLILKNNAQSNMRWIFNYLYVLLSLDRSRSDDINKLEAIPKDIWDVVVEDIP